MKKKTIMLSLILAAATMLSACGAEKDTKEKEVQEQTEDAAVQQEDDTDSGKSPAKENSISAGIDENTTSKYGECGDDLMWYLQETDGTLVIRGTGNMTFSTYERPWYQYREDIHTVIIEDGCTSIGSRAFQELSLESITIPDTVTEIEDEAFKYSRINNELVIPANLTSIGARIFDDANLSVVIPDGVTEIMPYLFHGCNLKSITIPDSVTSIGDYAFIGCDMRSITIPDSVTSIGVNAFNVCTHLESITISGAASIGDYAFSNCYALKSITFPNGVTSIGDGAFFQCDALESITIPSATYIEHLAFFFCDSLKEVVIENTDVEIGLFAFRNGTKVVIAGEEQIWEIDFDDEKTEEAFQAFIDKNPDVDPDGTWWLITNIENIER